MSMPRMSDNIDTAIGMLAQQQKQMMQEKNIAEKKAQEKKFEDQRFFEALLYSDAEQVKKNALYLAWLEEVKLDDKQREEKDNLAISKYSSEDRLSESSDNVIDELSDIEAAEIITLQEKATQELEKLTTRLTDSMNDHANSMSELKQGLDRTNADLKQAEETLQQSIESVLHDSPLVDSPSELSVTIQQLMTRTDITEEEKKRRDVAIKDAIAAEIRKNNPDMAANLVLSQAAYLTRRIISNESVRENMKDVIHKTTKQKEIVNAQNIVTSLSDIVNSRVSHVASLQANSVVNDPITHKNAQVKRDLAHATIEAANHANDALSRLLEAHEKFKNLGVSAAQEYKSPTLTRNPSGGIKT